MRRKGYANYLYDWALSQPLPYDEINFDKNVKLGNIIYTPDEFDICYFVEGEIK